MRVYSYNITNKDGETVEGLVSELSTCLELDIDDDLSFYDQYGEFDYWFDYEDPQVRLVLKEVDIDLDARTITVIKQRTLSNLVDR